ncbi:hypothetical protein, partial [Herbaspirillum sp.]|uniref:hypothetical protein n=1 Tax=Herbaspirillum sp. TaxID=1890675 RepID=UPI00258B8317
APKADEVVKDEQEQRRRACTKGLKGSRHLKSRRVAPQRTLLALPRTKRTVPYKEQKKVRERKQVQTKNKTEMGSHHR